MKLSSKKMARSGDRFDKDGNVKGKHDESKEKGEKEEH